MNEKRQYILNTFKQGHLIKKYESLDAEQKYNLMAQLELVSFDMVDLVNHPILTFQNFHNLIKMKKGLPPFPLFNPSDEHLMDPNYDMSEEEKELYTKEGLQLISEGKIGVIINVAGTSPDLDLKGPKCLHTPGWASDISILQYDLGRLQGLSQYAVKKYGKNFQKSREPILVFLMANDRDVQKIDDMLVSNQYYGYQGVICFSSRVEPNLTEKGKIIF